jgi:prolyl-tRNA editing enzyme YbaK/EbsC (Cys-tRNA(Pro) deacylase)
MTNIALNKSAQIVQNTLAQKGFDCTVIELPASTHTAVQAAEALGCQVAQIAKSLIFRTRNTHKPILILASGINRVDEKKIKEQMGEKIERADADFTREVTGFAIGGIPPLGHLQPLTTFIDEDLLQYDILWAAGGTPNTVFKFDAADLEMMTGGTVIAVK